MWSRQRAPHTTVAAADVAPHTRGGSETGPPTEGAIGHEVPRRCAGYGRCSPRDDVRIASALFAVTLACGSPADEDDPGAPGGGQTDAAPGGSADAGSDEFVEPAFEPDGFQGFGVQLYESLYDPAFVPQSTVDPASPALRDAMVAVEPGHVRIFVQNEAAVRPDTPEGAAAKESFSRVIDLAQAAGASVNVTWPGGYTGTGADFARLQMEGLAALLHEEVYERGHTAIRYVTIQNEGNTANPDHVCPGQKTGTYICRVDMNTAYRTLDALMRAQDPPLRGPDAPHLIRFIGGDLVYGRGEGDNDNGYQSWMTWMDQNMDDILDGWSIHVYWFYWNQWVTSDSSPLTGSGVTLIKQAMAHRNALGGKPLYIMEAGVRGRPDRVTKDFPGFYQRDCTVNQAGCTAMEDTIESSIDQAYFDVTAARLGYRAVTKWEATRRGDRTWGILGAPWNDWPRKPSWYLRDMWNAAVEPGWKAFAAATSAPPYTVAAGFRPADRSDTSVLLVNGSTSARDVEVRQLPAGASFKVWSWNQPGRAGQVCYRAGKTASSAGTLTVTLQPRNAVVLTTRSQNAGFPPCP